jgi:SAM-dependent methyltransferase
MWAVLTHPDKRGGRWDVDEFFATGVKDVNDVMARVDQHAIQLIRGRALDFGCGVGRLSQALAAHFDEVVGVDIAASMVDAARRLDHSGGRCTFVVNVTDDLSQFAAASFDFVYTHITLQHMAPRYSMRYIREFTRLLRPGGVVVFQVPVPNGRVRIRDLVKQTFPGLGWAAHRLRHGGEPLIQMYAVQESRVDRILAEGDVRIFAKADDPNTGHRWHSVVFYGQKNAVPIATTM